MAKLSIALKTMHNHASGHLFCFSCLALLVATTQQGHTDALPPFCLVLQEINCGILCTRLLSVRNHCLHLTLQISHSSKNF